jgi:hypothetical protein
MANEVALIQSVCDRVREHIDPDGRLPSCTAEQASQLARDAYTRLKTTLPPGYLAMLRVLDGFNYNVTVILASSARDAVSDNDAPVEGIIEDNLDYWDHLDRDLVVLGYGESEYYHSDRTGSIFGKSLRDTDSVVREYQSFADLLIDAVDFAKIPVRDLVPSDFMYSRYWE